MKPIRLVIAGLNSFKEEQTIDFTRLCQGTVFGIFGPTGSGKSTVVDAITLALYGSVKRATRRTQGIVNKTLDEASVLFEFQLGSGAECKHYLVERKYVAKDESVNCRLARLSELQDGETIVLADKPSLVDQAIQDILGLTEDDFTRAVVLPQGRFAEFLNLQGSERRRMLERIFGLEEYGEQLNKLVNDRLKMAENDYLGIKRSQEVLGEATAEAVQAALRLEQASKRELQASKSASAEARNQQEEWGRIRERQQELEAVRQSLAKLQQQSTQIHDLEAKLERQVAAQRVAGALQAFDTAAWHAAEATTALQQLTAEVTQIEQAERQAQVAAQAALVAKQAQEGPLLQKLEQLKRAIALEQQVAALVSKLAAREAAGVALKEQLATEEQALDVLRATSLELDQTLQAWQQEQEQHRIAPEQREQLAQAVAVQDSYAALAKQLGEVTADCVERQKQVAAAQAELASAEAQLATQRAAQTEQQELLAKLLAQAPASVTSQQLTTANAYLKEAQRLAYDGGRLTQYLQTVANLESTVGQIQLQLAAAREEGLAAEQAVRAAEQTVTQLEQESVTARGQNMAALLAQTLQPGQPCPVCGSSHHPAPIADVVSTQVEEVEKALAAARTQLTQQQALRATAAATLVAQQAELKRQQAALLENKRELQIYEAKVKQQLSKFPTEWVTGNAWSAVPPLAQEHLDKLSESFSQRARWENELDQSKAALEACRELFLQQQQQIELLTQAIAAHQAELDRLLTRQTGLQEEIARKQSELNSCLAALGQTNLTEARSHYQERDKRLVELERLIKHRQAEKEQLHVQIRQAEQAIGKTKEQQTEARAEYRLHKEQLSALQTELEGLTGGAGATDLQESAQLALATLREQADNTQLAWEQVGKQLAIARQNFSAGQEASRLAAITHRQTESVLAVALEREQFVTRGEAEEALGWAELVAEWQQTISTHKKQSEFLQGRAAELTKLLAGQSISEQDWLQVVSQAQVAEEQYLQAVEALATAQAALTNVQERHQQWLELETELQRIAKQKDLLSELVSLLRGNALVEFMAGEHLDAIAGIATDWLDLLTGQRYALEVAPDGGFLIRDDGNGGVKRPVYTLSGGETFITSLALALALSSQIQLRGRHRLEFFFLDEGFGSLDPNLLEVVMGCLERMQGQAMSIGIISHVPELKERVLRQVVVSPAQPGGRGSRVQVIAG